MEAVSQFYEIGAGTSEVRGSVVHSVSQSPGPTSAALLCRIPRREELPLHARNSVIIRTFDSPKYSNGYTQHSWEVLCARYSPSSFAGVILYCAEKATQVALCLRPN